MKQKETKGYHITHFNKGDLIYRCSPSVKTQMQYNETLGVSVEVAVGHDNSFRSTPVEFICIENDIIYAKSPVKDSFLNKHSIYKMLVDEYGENWMPYIIPDGLTIEDCL